MAFSACRAYTEGKVDHPHPTQAANAGLEDESRSMQRGFGVTAFEPEQERADREVTVGPVMLTLLGIGLCGMCALCFVWGYSVGHRAPVAVASAPTPAGPSAAQLLANSPKPAATENSLEARTAATASTGAAGAPSVAVVVATQPSNSTAGSLPQGGAVVQAALPAQPATLQTGASTGAVQAALGATGQWAVQIASVSNPEDADVLVSALRKRGYGVSAHRDASDDLIHVRVGPFATHSDAAAMRQRLLNDGYNAMIQP